MIPTMVFCLWGLFIQNNNNIAIIGREIDIAGITMTFDAVGEKNQDGSISLRWTNRETGFIQIGTYRLINGNLVGNWRWPGDLDEDAIEEVIYLGQK